VRVRTWEVGLPGGGRAAGCRGTSLRTKPEAVVVGGDCRSRATRGLGKGVGGAEDGVARGALPTPRVVVVGTDAERTEGQAPAGADVWARVQRTWPMTGVGGADGQPVKGVVASPAQARSSSTSGGLDGRGGRRRRR